jgi:hypothetical membrane protein
MAAVAEGQYTITKVIRWTARVWSIASIGIILLFIFGEGMKRVRPSEWLLFLFFPAGICIGMKWGIYFTPPNTIGCGLWTY